MKYKYHVVYFFNKGNGSIEIDSNCKIDNMEAIKTIEKIVKDKNNLDGNVILVNWIKLRTTENIWLRISAFAQTLLCKASHILKRCTKWSLK